MRNIRKEILMTMQNMSMVALTLKTQEYYKRFK